MTKRRRVRLDTGQVPTPKRPYRDSAILYAVLAVAIVLVAWLTGGGLIRAVVVAVAFFVIATAWSWWRFRERIREAERR